MRIAIVGAGKLTENEERDARQLIGIILTDALNENGDDLYVVSGGSKGIDTIAEDIAIPLNIKTTIYKPEIEQWEDKDGKRGYKSRNLLIAEDCDKLYCFPAGYRDRRCYHCDQDHQVGGGCWTMWQARRIGKETKMMPPIKR
jgi:hypothetical protein